jgi:uncharacterized protein (DUF952 family)
MRLIFHLVPRSVWDASPADYSAESLATEGFIHCSYAAQVERSANRFFAGAEDLLVLHLDPDRLGSPLREEPAGSGELFPHVYGPINRSAVVAVQPLRRDPGGCWRFDPGPPG